MFLYPRWILCGVTESGVLMAGAAVPDGVHPPVWLVAGCVVVWAGTHFGEGSAVVGFAAFAVGCAEVVVVAEKNKEIREI